MYFFSIFLGHAGAEIMDFLNSMSSDQRARLATSL